MRLLENKIIKTGVQKFKDWATNVEWKKLLITNIPFAMIFLFADRFACLYRSSSGDNMGVRIYFCMEHADKVISSFMPSFYLSDMIFGFAIAAIIKILILQKRADAKKLRKGVEYGSARWGNREDIKPYMADDPMMNIPLTATEALTMESRPKQPKYARNKNILVIGGSGSGKTRFFVKPSIMQMHSSYVVTDPKGTLILECGKMLKKGTPKVENGKIVRDKELLV